MRNTKLVKKTKRDLIIDAGIRLFARFPFSEITVAAVAREANCGHSLVYHYFKNINELYEESVNFVTSYFSPFVKSIDQKETAPLILFVGSITQHVELLKSNPMNSYYLSLIIYQYAEIPKSERIAKLKTKWYKSLVALLTKGIETGVLITLLKAEEILKSLQNSFQGLVSSLMFSGAENKDFHASTIYLPFLKGVHNV